MKNKILIFGIAVAVLAVAAIHDQDYIRQAVAKQFFNRAGNYFSQNNYDLDKAENWYKKALAVYPRLSNAHYQLARIYFVENKLDEAKKEIDIALAINPVNQRAFYVRGLINGFAKNYEEAISDFEKFTAWSPKEWAGWNDLAWVNYEASDYVKTKDAALEGLKIDTENPWLLNNLGLAYLGLGEKDEAQAVFEKAKKNSDSLTLEDWQKAYPGNNPNSAEWNLAKFKDDIRYNATFLASEQKGIAASACGSSSYGACGAGICQQNPCLTCEPLFLTGKFGEVPFVHNHDCCAASQCSSNADCYLPLQPINICSGVSCVGVLCDPNRETCVNICANNIDCGALPAVNLSGPDTVEIPDDVYLNWTVVDAESCQASGEWSGSKSTSGGNETIWSPTTPALRGNHNFNLTCSNRNGSTSDSQAVRVVQVPRCTFTANPTTIILPQTSTLSWSCDYADTCSIDQGIGSVNPVSGSKEVRPSKTTTYTLTCDGIDGARASISTVNVGFTPKIREVAPW